MSEDNVIESPDTPRNPNLLEERSISPVSLEEVKEIVDAAYKFAANAKPDDYQTNRGIHELFEQGNDYAQLPWFQDAPPEWYLKKLGPANAVLDVGCGQGRLGAQIKGTSDEDLPPINSRVKYYGLDAQAQAGQERLDGVVIGNLDDLSPKTFGGKPARFKLIIASSLLYHLPDPWGGLQRMAWVLNEEGLLLASAAARVIHRFQESAETKYGDLNQGVDPEDVHYYRQRNVFDAHGNIIPPMKVAQIIEVQNPGYRIQYSVASSQQGGTDLHGGQIAIYKRFGQEEDSLNLSRMFYCIKEMWGRSGHQRHLGYILAQTPEEATELRKQGFVSVQDRYLVKFNPGG